MQYSLSGSNLGTRDALPSMAGPHMKPQWLHPRFTSSGHTESTNENNLPYAMINLSLYHFILLFFIIILIITKVLLLKQ